MHRADTSGKVVTLSDAAKPADDIDAAHPEEPLLPIVKPYYYSAGFSIPPDVLNLRALPSTVKAVRYSYHFYGGVYWISRHLIDVHVVDLMRSFRSRPPPESRPICEPRYVTTPMWSTSLIRGMYLVDEFASITRFMLTDGVLRPHKKPERAFPHMTLEEIYFGKPEGWESNSEEDEDSHDKESSDDNIEKN